ncbi:DUF1381 domain-containing protein [Staphylococcus xylosus]|uniref:DUF1381 domain-containing protein n=1 Tax=Staphylococcus xylosus TaxID=1288 RepID=UPI003F54784E
MTNYLIKHTTHTTGETFTDVTKIRDNETYQVVEAESKEEALEMVKKPKGLVERMNSICKEQLIESLEQHGIRYKNKKGQ